MTVVGNVVAETEAGARAFSFWGAETPAAIFSQERRAVWDWTAEEEVPAQPTTQRLNRFLVDGTILDGLRQVRWSLQCIPHGLWSCTGLIHPQQSICGSEP